MKQVTIFNPVGVAVSRREMSNVGADKALKEAHENGVRCDVVPACPHGHGALQALRGREGHWVEAAPESNLRTVNVHSSSVGCWPTVWACSTCEYADR